MAGSISTLGVGSGLQLQDILDQLRSVDQAVVDRKQDDITALDAQLEEFTTVKNNLLTLKSSALDLSLSSTFLGRTVSSSNEKVIEATVLDGATVKSTTIEVVKLAEQSSWLSNGVSAASDSIASGTSTFAYNLGETNVSLVVTAGTTLQQLADQINDDTNNPGVTASVINTGESASSYKLFVQSDGLGDDNRIDLLATPITMTRQQDITSTLDAQFKIDGISYQRASNTINDVVASLTFTLKDTGTETITVASNDGDLKDKIVGMVTAFNDAMQELRLNTSYDSETGEFGILSGTTMRDLPYELQNLMSRTITADSTGEIRNLFDLGMEFDRDGNITINDATLSAVISENSEKIKLFFLGDSDNAIDGFADTVNNRLRTLTSGTGAIEGEKSAAQAKIDDLGLHIEEETARLDKKYAQLTQQFVALDRFMSEMTSMSNFLTGQFDSLSSGWSGGSSGK